MWLAAVVAHALDAATTQHALSTGQAKEMNPFMGFVIDRFGFMGMWGVKAGALAWMYRDSRGEDGYTREMAAFTALLHGVWPVVNNLAETRYH